MSRVIHCASITFRYCNIIIDNFIFILTLWDNNGNNERSIYNENHSSYFPRGPAYPAYRRYCATPRKPFAHASDQRVGYRPFIGMICNYFIGDDHVVHKGATFTSKKLLKLGIILLGAPPISPQSSTSVASPCRLWSLLS